MTKEDLEALHEISKVAVHNYTPVADGFVPLGGMTGVMIEAWRKAGYEVIIRKVN